MHEREYRGHHYGGKACLLLEVRPMRPDDAGRVVGYAWATSWRGRSAYRYSVETSAYVEESERGRGVGAALYRRLLAELRARGVHAVLAGIAQPNVASERLHERLGFEKVAHLREVGYKFDRWIDVAYWELVLAPRPADRGHCTSGQSVLR